MRIQGKKMWIAGQFMAAQLLIEEGVIRQVLPYGAKEADEDYGDTACFLALLIFTPTVLTDMIQTTPDRRGLESG